MSVSSRNSLSMNPNLDPCVSRYQEYQLNSEDIYCNSTCDENICWPPTRAGEEVTRACPQLNGYDTTKYVSKRCSIDGQWEGITANDSTASTDYTPCYTPELLKLLKMLNTGPEGAAKAFESKVDIAKKTRLVEIVGLTISLAALLLSLAIFFHFRSLKNNRTRIHKNLFMAMVCQVVIRLILYIDQAINRNAYGISDMPVVCELTYILLEYAKTAMFMWMFLEGFYLHCVITVTHFDLRFKYALYALFSWGGSLVMAAVWATTTALCHGHTKCWWGYNLTYYFWILEGPRMGIVMLNFLFLLNIIRILVVKLRASHTRETEIVRKAVRAAIVLLPLLGITNLANMVHAPVDRAVWEFAMWSFVTHFLSSFQGFFVALIYCFLNGEVRTAIKKNISTYLLLRHQIPHATRASLVSSVCVHGNDNAHHRREQNDINLVEIHCTDAALTSQPMISECTN